MTSIIYHIYHIYHISTLFSPYRIFPISESALTVDFGNVIDKDLNQEILTLFHYLGENPLEGMIETVPAYSSITIYYDVVFLRNKNPSLSAFEQIKKMMEHILEQPVTVNIGTGCQRSIPVCYDGGDLSFIAKEKDLSIEEIIHIHSSSVYQVFMLGFLPGFAYMGPVDERIQVSRKPHPAQVSAGSVGIAGSQTGIYPLQSPGGWQIIGRTPLSLFDATGEEPTLLKAGDTIRFYSISSHEFASY